MYDRPQNEWYGEGVNRNCNEERSFEYSSTHCLCFLCMTDNKMSGMVKMLIETAMKKEVKGLFSFKCLH